MLRNSSGDDCGSCGLNWSERLERGVVAVVEGRGVSFVRSK